VVGHAPDAEEIAGLEEQEAVLSGETPARLDLVPDWS
jgi:hypothetical protein